MELEYFAIYDGYRIRRKGRAWNNYYTICDKLGLSIIEYETILENCGADYFSDHHDGFLSFPIFHNVEDAQRAIEKLESILIMKNLLK